MAKLLLSVLFIVLVAVPVAGAHDGEHGWPGWHVSCLPGCTIPTWPGCFVHCRPEWAVLVVDVQPCFVTGGSLAVAGADAAYVYQAQRATQRLFQKGFLILGSRDYHPSDHISFYTNHPGAKPFDVITLPDGRTQVLWPPHCVQTGGDSRELVDNNLFFELVKKGQDPNYDSYSAFRDDHGANTELDGILHARGVTHLVVYGIATDYCVRASVMDAISLGYKVVVIQDLIRGVAPDTSAAAIAEMKAAGAVFVSSDDFLEE